MIKLSEESQHELDQKLHLLKYHDMITLTYFQENQNVPQSATPMGQYKEITSTVEYIDPLHRYCTGERY